VDRVQATVPAERAAKAAGIARKLAKSLREGAEVGLHPLVPEPAFTGRDVGRIPARRAPDATRRLGGIPDRGGAVPGAGGSSSVR